eukprot:TRINITY_DN6195_c0_g2_i14.p1 TRINITY_DN6195_c0_g2~~TRINITY_DN6195_c0_g2_i14.p1  ORF type:complete len:114 (-),score=11.23 TRINITY_DN6195_c0_g2_i14:25-366(-)
MKARIMPIQSFTLKDHTALPFPYLPHVQASSSRTGVTRGRVSPCHLFPSSFAFPLGEMPNEGRRRMKIKVCLRVFKNLCLISVFVVLTTEPCKSSPSHHSLFVRYGEVTNSSF